MKQVLIIEDDEAIAAIEKDYLELSDFVVDIAKNGKTGLRAGLNGNYDLILLDLMLPDLDGFSICRKLREKIDTPILMVSARREDIDKIRGFGFGADDYIEKPFSPSVLVARVKAHISRFERLRGNSFHEQSQISIGSIRLDTQAHRVYVKDKPIDLANKEYELLCFLMINSDTIFNREDLYEQLWGMDGDGDNITVAVHINRLRKKIEADPNNPKLIQTVRGAGYRFNAFLS
ncbi:MAG: response regulator transcription factor [Spirochaetia bacterium]|jgi:DNA-binding response OmpR family regulator|nr:response regulator transcription factor [Spirochaetia bacterium]